MSEALMAVEFDLRLAVAPKIKETLQTKLRMYLLLVLLLSNRFCQAPTYPFTRPGGQVGFRCTSESKVNRVDRELAQK